MQKKNFNFRHMGKNCNFNIFIIVSWKNHGSFITFQQAQKGGRVGGDSYVVSRNNIYDTVKPPVKADTHRNGKSVHLYTMKVGVCFNVMLKNIGSLCGWDHDL